MPLESDTLSTYTPSQKASRTTISRVGACVCRRPRRDSCHVFLRGRLRVMGASTHLQERIKQSVPRQEWGSYRGTRKNYRGESATLTPAALAPEVAAQGTHHGQAGGSGRAGGLDQPAIFKDGVLTAAAKGQVIHAVRHDLRARR